LWDIGANVGIYTLVAALRGVRVCSFEPSPGNYYILSRNIELNGFDDRIDSLCVAFSDITGLDSFYMANTQLGGALNAYGTAIDWKGHDMDTKYRQSMLGFSIDNFLEQFNPPFPNHIKIDVDGIERKIIKGGSRTLSDQKVKSVLVELDIEHEETNQVVNFMSDMGLRLSERTHAPFFDSGPYSSVYNHIFVRDGHPDAVYKLG
jgi:FkbM family methyltransferase